jgi:uncharacterized membrane protein YhaH (DUF805 family)
MMNIQTAVKTCFSKYATFSGRASRSEYWFFYLFTIIASIVTWVIDTMLLGYSAEDTGAISLIFQIIIILPSIAVGARRLHDIGKSGWWQLLILTIIGIILLIVWFATIGSSKKNKYGNPIKLKK